MYLIQANEVLFKLVLKQHHEYLMFNDFNKYMQSKEKLLKDGYIEKTVLDYKPSLKTVTLMESINRLQFLCDVDVDMDNEFKTLLLDINKERKK